ncbi:hypothetical protein [Leclercia tamurae]|uniref:hypothetical protein n=1 Tax=Leclercia tamurae TaxID=2926467 RepID=UPI0036F49FFB
MSRYKKIALFETFSMVLALWLSLLLPELSHAMSAQKVDVYSRISVSTPVILHVGGIRIERDGHNIMTINGKPTMLIENGSSSTVYSQDRYSVVFYKHSRKVELMEDGAFVGWAE